MDMMWFDSVWSFWHWALPLGFLLDALIGDPAWLPHPVRFLGGWVRRVENFLRHKGWDGIGGGLLLWLLVVGASALFVILILFAAYQVHPYVGHGAQVLLFFQGFALSDLDKEVRHIYLALRHGDLAYARERTARIVSRSTTDMDEGAMSRSAIESAAENGVDGVLAPLFWAVLTGPLGLWIYKATSTLDSMVGYRTPAYEKLGKVSARMDDLLNWIPARISIALYALSWPSRAFRGIHIAWRDHALHASPNSGWSEAMMSGLLRKRLGGPAIYHGVRKEKTWFGKEFPDVLATDIPQAMRTVRLSAFWALLFGAFSRSFFF